MCFGRPIKVGDFTETGSGQAQGILNSCDGFLCVCAYAYGQGRNSCGSRASRSSDRSRRCAAAAGEHDSERRGGRGGGLLLGQPDHKPPSPFKSLPDLNLNRRSNEVRETAPFRLAVSSRLLLLQGSAVMFSGKNRHRGVPITSGVRYILGTYSTHTKSAPRTNSRESLPLFEGFHFK